MNGHPPPANRRARHCAAVWILSALCAVITQSLVACATLPVPATPGAAPQARPTSPASPEPAHDFSLPTLDDETVALAALQGRWVLINFWATWCEPCREEMPYLQALAEAHADTLVVLGVNMREDRGDVQAFVDAIGIEFPILLHPDDAMLLAYGPRGLPLTYVVAPDGVVAFKQFGPLRPAWFDPWLTAQLYE